MKTIIVGYDLNMSGQNYARLIERLKKYPNWWHHLDSTWILKTDETASAVLNTLRPLIDSNDELLVIEVQDGTAAWAGFPARGSEWLTNNL